MKKLCKRILFSGLFLFSQYAWSQNKVTIQGSLSGYSDNAIIYFMYADVVKGIQLQDSVKLKNNRFKKNIYISEPTDLGMIMSPDGRFLNKFTVEEQKAAEAIGFYIDKGEFNLTFDGSFVKWKMDSPMKIVTDFKAYNTIVTKDRQAAIDSINTHYAKDGKVNDDGTIKLKAEQVEAYKLAVANAEQKVTNNLLAFAKENTTSYIGLLAITSCFNAQQNLAPQLSALLNDYTAELQNTTLGKKLRIELEMSR